MSGKMLVTIIHKNLSPFALFLVHTHIRRRTDTNVDVNTECDLSETVWKKNCLENVCPLRACKKKWKIFFFWISDPYLLLRSFCSYTYLGVSHTFHSTIICLRIYLLFGVHNLICYQRKSFSNRRLCVCLFKFGPDKCIWKIKFYMWHI